MPGPDLVAVVPAYNPGEALLRLVDALRGRLSLLVVDDGSEDASVFERLPDGGGVTVLTHAANRGKGAALKTAFRHVVEHRPDAAGVVTVDADGQHLPADALKVAARLRDRVSPRPVNSPSPGVSDGPIVSPGPVVSDGPVVSPGPVVSDGPVVPPGPSVSDGAVVFGVRRFDGAVPPRNRFGNLVARGAVRALLGVRLSDTQTGLRGIPAGLLPALLDIPFDRYEFETEMLRTIREARLDIEEVPIRTVYFEAGRGSHFRPFRDSMRICRVLLRSRASAATRPGST